MRAGLMKNKGAAQNSQTLEELLRSYIKAISDATRGAIVQELGHADELTATQLAHRLGLSANNVYHHMRVLLQLGVVNPPRAVPGPTYVEKYYQLNPKLRQATEDPDWLDRTQSTMTPQERQALVIGMCLTMAHRLQLAARRYGAMDAETFDLMAHTEELLMISVNDMGRKRLVARLRELRALLQREYEEFPPSSDSASETDMVLIAGLPAIWGQLDDHP
jgi:DNA-binding transcriptional ArsR family regulator